MHTPPRRCLLLGASRQARRVLKVEGKQLTREVDGGLRLVLRNGVLVASDVDEVDLQHQVTNGGRQGRAVEVEEGRLCIVGHERAAGGQPWWHCCISGKSRRPSHASEWGSARAPHCAHLAATRAVQVAA